MTEELAEAPAQESSEPIQETTGQEETQASEATQEVDQSADAQEEAPDNVEDRNADVSPGVQKRIDEVIGRSKSLERKMNARHEQDSSKIAALESELAELKEAQTAQANEEPAEPNYEDFESAAEFEAARTKYMKDWSRWDREQADLERRKESKEENAQAQRQQQANQVAQDFKKREAEFSKDLADYDDHVDPFLRGLKPDNVTANVIGNVLRHEKGPAVLYEMAKNKQLAIDVFATPDSFMADKIDMVASQLDQSTNPKPQPEPLPTPPQAIKGGGGNAKSLAKMSGREILDHLAAVNN